MTSYCKSIHSTFWYRFCSFGSLQNDYERRKEEGNWSWNFHYMKKAYQHLDGLNLCCSSVCGVFFGWFKHICMFKDPSFFWGSFGLMGACQPCRRMSSHGKRSARDVQGGVWLALVSPARNQHRRSAQVVCCRVLWIKIWRAALQVHLLSHGLQSVCRNIMYSNPDPRILAAALGK